MVQSRTHSRRILPARMSVSMSQAIRVRAPVPGADIRFVQDDVRPVHQEMARAARDRNVWLVGGGELVGQFADRGLLDEVLVGIAPVTLGAGAPLLPRRVELELVELGRNGDFVAARFAVKGSARGET